MGKLRAILIIVVILASFRTASGQCISGWLPGESLPGVDGLVVAMIEWDPDGDGPSDSVLIVGGSFTTAGNQRVSGIAAWDGSSWGLSPFNEHDFVMEEVVALGTWNGALVAAGQTFHPEDLHFDFGVAILTESGWQMLGNYADGPVNSLAEYQGALFAGGSFTWLDSPYAHGLAKWNGSSWQPTDINEGAVLTMKVFQNKLILGGADILGVGLQNYSTAVSWDGKALTSMGYFDNGVFLSFTEYQGQLIVGGEFYRNSTFRHSAYWDGADWKSLGNPSVPVASVVVWNGQLFATHENDGNYSPGATVSRWDGLSWKKLGEYFSGVDAPAVLSSCVYHGELFVGGDFKSAGDGLPKRVARWDGAAWVKVGPGFDGTVRSFAEYNGRLVIGGSFIGAGNQTVNNIAIRNGDSWQPLDSGLDNVVMTLTTFNGDLIAAGFFSSASGIPANLVARWDGSNWHALGDGVQGPAISSPAVYSSCVYANELVVAGKFSQAGSQSALNVAAWNGSTWRALGNPPLSYVNQILVWNGKLIACGGQSALYSWDGSNWRGPDNNQSGFDSLAVFRGELFAALGYTNDSSRIYRYNGQSLQYLGANPDFRVFAMSVHQDKLYAAGGSYDHPLVGNHISCWEGASWTTVHEGPNSNIDSLGIFGDFLEAGGAFTHLGNYASPYWAQYGPSGPAPTIAQQPPSPLICQGSAVSLHSSAVGNGALTYHWRKNGVDLSDDADTFGAQTDTLVFAHAAASDTGNYDCVVKLNDCTQTISSIAALSVFPTNTADGNGDAAVDGRDIAQFVNAMVNYPPVSAPLCAYDLTGDGIVNLDDLTPFVSRLLGE